MPIPQNDPIVVAPTPTPFHTNGKIDYDSLTRNVKRWLKTPLSGFVLGTATGEELALNEEEQIEIVRTVNKAHEGKGFIIGGIDIPSTKETLRLAHRYTEAGADLLRVRIPRGLQPKTLEEYFLEITNHSPIPIMIIHQTFSNIPAAPPEVLGALSQLDNVFGYITDANMRFEGKVRRHVPKDRRFWICNGGLLLYGMLMGANGACMWLGNLAPSLCMDIVRLGYQCRFADGRPLQVRATRLDEIIQYGVGGIKVALELLGFEGKCPRSPSPSVDPNGRKRIQAILREVELL